MFTALLVAVLAVVIGGAAYVGLRNVRGGSLSGAGEAKQLTDGRGNLLLERWVVRH